MCRIMIDCLLDTELRHKQKMRFTRVLHMSVNYWSTYQLFGFINNLFWHLEYTMSKYKSRFTSKLGPEWKYDPTLEFGWRCHELVCWRAAKYGQKYGPDALKAKI